MIICVCNRLNEAEVREAVAAGARNPEAVYAGCGVNRNCGCCVPMMEQMIAESGEGEALAAIRAPGIAAE